LLEITLFEKYFPKYFLKCIIEQKWPRKKYQSWIEVIGTTPWKAFLHSLQVIHFPELNAMVVITLVDIV
jgi:hypothetical protein